MLGMLKRKAGGMSRLHFCTTLSPTLQLFIWDIIYAADPSTYW